MWLHGGRRMARRQGSWWGSCKGAARLLCASWMLLVLTRSSLAAPTSEGADTAIMYLAKYGYLSSIEENPAGGGVSNMLDEKSWREAILEFQSFTGLNATGELDDDTKKLMLQPRCGVKDKMGSGESRAKRYAFQGTRWRRQNIKYKIFNYPARLNRAQVDLELAKAFNVWSKYTDLTFTQKTTGPVHIKISFVKGPHGDGYPLDGRGKTLAHAFAPIGGGEVHFDDEEMWSFGPEGTDLFHVAVHEFGHSLGLLHSKMSSATMYPFYHFNPTFQLNQDDVLGIQKIYGQKTTTEDPALCSDPKIDTILEAADGSTFIFKGEKCWKLIEDGVASSYPRLISKEWPGLPDNIDAAFTYKNGKTYFFKGSKYWRYIGHKVDGDYPKEISEGFAGIPDNIDSALVWSGNGKMYFFKGSKFWKFDPAQQPPVKSTYPKPLSIWKGIPDSIDAALLYTDGYTYFFKGGSYWRFNDDTFSVDTDIPAFPRSTAYWWLGCTSLVPRGTVKDYLQAS